MSLALADPLYDVRIWETVDGQFVRRPGAVQTRAVHTRSLDFRVEEFLRTRGAHVGLSDEGGASIDIGRHRLALRGGDPSLDAVIAHAEWVLHDEPGDHAALQEPSIATLRPSARSRANDLMDALQRVTKLEPRLR
jgi:hypothetical protein